MDEQITSPDRPHLEFTRDENWYFSDGSVVIRAENSLFKVHKSLFEKESKFFESLFSLPQDTTGDEVTEGLCDEHPIVWPDSVADFRDLCWVMYSSPLDISDQLDPTSINVPMLIRVAAISHKYEFTSYLDWVLRVLLSFSQSNSILGKCTQWDQHVCVILNLAYGRNAIALAGKIEDEWIQYILGDLPNSLPGDASTAFRSAISVAEISKGLRMFQGRVYYSYLKRIGMLNTNHHQVSGGYSMTNIISSVEDPSLTNLNEEQKSRIRQGYWSLSQLRLRLLQAPDFGTRDSSCTTHGTCKIIWKKWWKDVLNEARARKEDLNDPWEIIEIIDKELADSNDDHYPPGARVRCNRAIKRRLLSMKKDFHGCLPNHFVIPEE